MISRTCFASCHACAIRSRRLGPMPSTVCNFRGALFDHHKNLGSKSPNQLLRENRADALHQAAAEIPLDPIGGGGRHCLHGVGFELQPVFPVPDPASFRDQPFPSGHRGQRSHDCRLLSMTFCLDPKHTESAVVVVEGDALDDAGNFLGRGSALWHCGVHVGIHFDTDGWGSGVPQEGDSAGGWLPGGVRVGSAFQRRWEPLGPVWRACGGTMMTGHCDSTTVDSLACNLEVGCLFALPCLMRTKISNSSTPSSCDDFDGPTRHRFHSF